MTCILFPDGATVISVDPKAGSVDKLYKKDFVEFRCHAEANPLPSYRWVHHSSRGSITLGHERTPKLSNLEYDDQVRLNVIAIGDFSDWKGLPKKYLAFPKDHSISNI